MKKEKMRAPLNMEFFTDECFGEFYEQIGCGALYRSAVL
jgi:hypothetical protein